MSNYLIHYGVPGMKWGVRHDKEHKWNKGYSEIQRKRDRKVYGKGGVRRINRDMNRYGDSISGARSTEASRINRARRTARVAGQIGSIIGGVGGFYIGDKSANGIGLDPASKLAVSTGSSILTAQLARYGGQSIAMLSYGYSPDKYR